MSTSIQGTDMSIALPSREPPDQDRLGRARGYPVGLASNWCREESVRVGSFTHQGEIPGLYNGASNTLQASERPLLLPRASGEPSIRWDIGEARGLTLEHYLARQRVMGLMVVKDGVVQIERYQYERTADHRFLSNSMAKSIMALAIGIAHHEGSIVSLDDRADHYCAGLTGALYGETTIRNLLRMASGARFSEVYDGKDDLARFTAVVCKGGIETAAHVITTRQAAQGTRFNYSSAETDILAAVLRGATGTSVSEFLTPRLWRAIGAERSALWRADRTGLERASGNFNAVLRDYARLGIVLANDGERPDRRGEPIIPRALLLDSTDWSHVPEAFRPGRATHYYGYGLGFWLFPGVRRRMALLGVFGQMMFIDPELRLVMVQTAANATAKAAHTSLAAEADAFWRGLVAYYGRW